MAFLRLISEIAVLKRVLAPADFRASMVKLITSAPQILRHRNLGPLDQAMSRDITIEFHGRPIKIPVGTIDSILAGTGDNATFGAVREMFGRDVYLRAFKPFRDVCTVVDLGSNRGFFSLIAAKLWNPGKIVSVEPTAFYNKTFDAIAEANGIDRTKITRINKFASNTDDNRTISLGRLMEENGLSRIDFLKSDIEGGEFNVFNDNPEVVRRVMNLAMEVHPWIGNVHELVAFLTSAGLLVMTTDQHGHIVTPDKAMYLYASREGQVRPPFFKEGVAGLSPYAKVD